MKILYVITKSNWGGAQRYVYDLATNLPKESFEVVVALGGTGEAGAEAGPLAEKLTAAGIRVVFVRSFIRDVSLLRDLRSVSELMRILRRERPHVVHLNSSKAGGVGAVAARLAGVPHIIYTVHGWPFWEKRSGLSRAFIWFASWITALLCTKVIVISEYDRAIARRMPFIGGKIVRIYNGIDDAPALGSGERIRSAFPAGAHITGTIGELTKNKNQIVLIEEARRNPEMYVAIVGTGEEQKRLEANIRAYGLEARVKLFGFIPAAEALKGFDTFALPSLKEGLPYVLLEARAAGLPIEANRNIGGIAEILNAPDLKEFSLARMLAETEALYR